MYSWPWRRHLTNLITQLDSIFRPRSIAVIGASDNSGKWGHFMVERPLRTGYSGPIYPVNPQMKSLLGLRVYPSVNDIPGQVDFAIITVQAHLVPSVMKDCARKGIRAAMVISAGFAETGPEGRALEDETVRIARAGGIRFIGPNCMGIWSAIGDLNTAFHTSPKAGSIAFISQSGTFGGYMSEMASAKGYGLRAFVSVGNQADLEIADYLEYLSRDDGTKAIILYIEGVKDGRRFLESCREALRKKPIVLYKGGSSAAGARATLSHTASIAGSEVVFDSACRQLGVIRAEEAFQTFEMAMALIAQPLPPGRRIGVLGTGGQAVVSIDACQHLGLEVPVLDSGTSQALMKMLPSHAPIPRNPVDFAGSYRTALDEANVVETLLKLDYIDGVICNVPVSPLVWGYDFEKQGDPERLEQLGDSVARGVRKLCDLPSRYRKPIACLRWHRSLRRDLVSDTLVQTGIPVYDTPEQCARAMNALVNYSALRGRIRTG
jgi:acyl-CoA synthetase (NDP forming)